MAVNIIKLIQDSVFETAKNDLVVSSVLALKRLNKVVTGKTAQSMRGEYVRSDDNVEFSVYGSAGLKYILEGKPANTKLPVKKTGGKFELVQELKDWKAIVNFKGSDFILARTIAENKRDPVDVASVAIEIFNEMYMDKLSKNILSFTSIEMIKEIKTIHNGTSNN